MYHVIYINSHLIHCATTRHTRITEAIDIARVWLDCPNVDCEIAEIVQYIHLAKPPFLVKTIITTIYGE